jgi:hypothetical protein
MLGCLAFTSIPMTAKKVKAGLSRRTRFERVRLDREMASCYSIAP